MDGFSPIRFRTLVSFSEMVSLVSRLVSSNDTNLFRSPPIHVHRKSPSKSMNSGSGNPYSLHSCKDPWNTSAPFFYDLHIGKGIGNGTVAWLRKAFLHLRMETPFSGMPGEVTSNGHHRAPLGCFPAPDTTDAPQNLRSSHAHCPQALVYILPVHAPQSASRG